MMSDPMSGARRRSQMGSPRTAADPQQLALEQTISPGYQLPYETSTPSASNPTPQVNNGGIGGQGMAAPPASQRPQPVQVEVPGQMPAGQPPASAPPDSGKVDYTKLGGYLSTSGPWNAGNPKLQQPWDQMSERYKMLTVMSNFDPTKGISPELVNALNAANIKGAKFSGSGDKLSATGLNQWENYDGREGLGDVIQGFKTGQGQWVPWAPEGGGASPAQAASMGGYGAGYQPPAGVQGLLASQLGLQPQDSGSYSQQIMQLLAQQLGLGQALGGGR